MYIMINTLNCQSIKAGEVVVVKYDKTFNAIGAFGIGGNAIGYVAEKQPDGCVDSSVVYANISDNRILCKAIVSITGMVILSTESRVLERKNCIEYCVKENYGILAIK